MISLPKLQYSSRDFQIEKEKKQIIFRNSYRNAQPPREKDSFRINHIVRGARENNTESSTPVMPTRNNNNANRAQLTPIKNDSTKQINNFGDDKRRKMDRLDPISFDSQKKL